MYFPNEIRLEINISLCEEDQIYKRFFIKEEAAAAA